MDGSDSDRRWPRRVYRAGDEPDPRFSFANERTLLAWIRTALGLLAAGVVVDAVEVSMPDQARRGLAALLVTMGAIAAVGGWFRWVRAEQALRLGRPLPAPTSAAVVVAVLVLSGAVVLAALVLA